MGFCSRDLFSHARKQCGENGSVLRLKYLKVGNEKKHSRSLYEIRGPRVIQDHSLEREFAMLRGVTFIILL